MKDHQLRERDMFKGFLLGVVLAFSATAMPRAEALQHMGGNGYCYVSVVSWAGGSNTQYYDCFETGGGGGGGGGREYRYYDAGGGGGGGGSNREQLLPVPGSTDTVSANGKKVATSRLNCGDEVDLRQQAVQRAVLYLHPFFGAENIVTLYMSSGEVQSFNRVSNSGSYQFAPTSGCGPP